MKQNLELPELGVADAEGFRSFSLYTRGMETLRVSIHIERFRDDLVRTAPDVSAYSQEELRGLQTAAALLSGKEGPFKGDQKAALSALQEISSKGAALDLEEYFPFLARRALDIAINACVKKGLNKAVKHFGAPRIYDESAIDLLLDDLKRAVNVFLMIEKGRPAETFQQLEDTREALRRIDEREHLRSTGKTPTQQQVADEIGREPRTLRTWLDTCGASWNEWLSACGWSPPAEGN